jgi:DNA-binding MarR family transcriptional regulator/catechol 2,3-dioxygenase-like lactoylglutathione lyase family enzyme
MVGSMDDPGLAELPTPTLMRAARGAYASSIRAQLHAIGVDDLPRNGAFLLAGIALGEGPRQNLPGDLGVSRQAVSQVIDILVHRGYVDRNADPDDRRRIALTLTEQGQQVMEAVVRGVDAVDLQLRERVSAGQVDAMRSALIALADITTASFATGAGRRRAAPQLRRFSPVFPVRNLADALAHYSALGFDTMAYDSGAEYGFADRDGTGLHLAADPQHDPEHHGAAAYLYVRDADALYEEWTRPGIGGCTRPVNPTPYKLREGSHVDPDGNLIRFGSPMAE